MSRMGVKLKKPPQGLCMAVYGCVWLYVWLCMAMKGYVGQCMAVYGYVGLRMAM